MRILRARLLQLEQEKQQAEQSAERKSQVRSADRSERIRTYNFPENRVTDHRIGYTVHRLGEILEGDLDDLIDALVMSERKATLGEGE
jgi:peptide chain release factor 1